MTKWRALAAGGVALAALAAISLFRTRGPAPRTAVLERKPFEVWSVYDGYIESRELRNVMSQLDGAATIVELIPEGTVVRPGDVVARFDGAKWEDDIVRLTRDFALAQKDLSVLTNATIPLELSDLEASMAQAVRQYSNEVFLLSTSRELRQEDLISDQELNQQEGKTQEAESLVNALLRKRDLMREYLHPLAVEKAEVTVATLGKELASSLQRLSNCVIRAPAGGVVSFKPMNIGQEFRAVREGDSVYRNLSFLTIPDMTDMVMRCEVPEGELIRVHAGCEVSVRPLSYPDLALGGVVESVGASAHSFGGRASSKYFSVLVRIDGRDERLRSGMTAQARILSYTNAAALVAPRAAIWWEGEKAWCDVLVGGRPQRRGLETGMASDAGVEVLSGLAEGEAVVIR